VARSTMITLGGDLRVGRIGYGAMRLTGPNLWGEYADRDGGIALLRQAAEAGVTLIDTADVYGPHANELLIREALHPYPEHLVIATKGGFVRGGPVGARPALIDAIGNANYLRQCAYLSARRLGVERIDLYHLHSGREGCLVRRPGRHSRGAAPAGPYPAPPALRTFGKTSMRKPSN
jgi:pyridoxine 4-dehydrogenase